MKVGDRVKVGDFLMVMIVMKMEVRKVVSLVVKLILGIVGFGCLR